MELFEDPLFQSFAERALLTLTGGGAELGECATAAARMIQAGSRVDADSWHREWTATATTVQGWAQASDERGHRVSAREAYLRASTYYRTANYPLFGAPVDPRLVDNLKHENHCFDRFAQLCDLPPRAVDVPFEDTTLPGYLCLAAADGTPRRTVIAVNGYDSNIHEMYFSHALPALRRGYNCLLVDGPGQGRPLVEQGLVMRPDWENVLRPVVDHALTHPEVDGAKLVVMGWSFGGFLAPRAVASEPRIAALVVDPGQWDQLEAARPMLPLPAELKDRLPDVDPTELDPHLQAMTAHPGIHWRLVQRGLWVHGLQTLGQYVVELGRYTLSDVAAAISCPTLVAQAEGDPISAHAERLYAALDCPKTLIRFTLAEGCGGHCETLNRSRFTQQAFDWLDDTLS
jgi:pimeloyl-ACP methyl ester carboxylesterase